MKYAVCNDTLKIAAKPEETLHDPLTELLRNGARELICQAVESELMSLFVVDPNHETMIPCFLGSVQ